MIDWDIAVGSMEKGVVASIAIIVIAIVVALTYGKHRHAYGQARSLARRRAARLTETMRLYRMAEQIAELGTWQYFAEDGRQEWSDGMKRLFGIDPSEKMHEGDAETLLKANDVDLVNIVMEGPVDRGPIPVDFSILRLDGQQRDLRLNAYHLRDRGAQTGHVVAVVLDVTSQRARERRLVQSREIALREARMAKELAETDPLTGLANRRRVMARLDRMVLGSRTAGTPLSLIAFDVDHFKRVNDSYGHPAGDEVLRKIAGIASRQARDGDVLGRIGGEEFVWILPGSNSDMAQMVANRLRQAIAVQSATGRVPPVTISLGLATVTGGDTGLSLFARADDALYQAKNAGRNTVRMAA